MQPGRAETIRYHQELFSGQSLSSASWLQQPSPLVMRALDWLAPTGELRVLDLGCGIGRHSLPIARCLGERCRIVAVDLLPIAAHRLMELATVQQVAHCIQAVVADFEAYAFESSSLDFVVACSVLEHASSEAAFRRTLDRAANATRPGGLHALVIGTDKVERTSCGQSSPALVEFPLCRATALAHIEAVYAGWTILELSGGDFVVHESRQQQAYELHTHCVRVLARRDAPRRS